MSRLACFLLCLFFASGVLYAQGSVATLNGTILDSTGAAIPGATVTATNIATGVETRTSTTSAGAYTLPYLAAGTYNLRVSHPGFRTALQENVIIRVGQVLTVNLTMEVGAVTEEVNVTAQAPLLESGTAEIGRYISTHEYQNWPIMVDDGQRQIQSFIFRSLPGTTGGEFEGSINGGQQYSHEILIEGIPLGRMDLSGGNNNEMSPSAETIQEFKLHTGAMGAQYNGGQTAVANFNVKSGTNELHGSAFYYNQNEALRGKNYSETSTGKKKSPFRLNNYGYAVGGPVYIPKVYNGKNKAFWFTNFERTTYSQFQISGFNTTLPTQDFKQGNFSRLLDPAFTGNARSGTVAGQDPLGRNIIFGQLYDPTTTRNAPDGRPVRDPFVGNIIPKNRWSNVSKNIVDTVGIINPDLDKMVRNTAEIGTCCPFFRLYTIAVKGDYHINQANQLSGYYNHEYRIRNNSPGGRYLPVPGLPTGVFQDQYTPSRMVRLSLNSTITPSLLNRIAAGYNRFRNTNESVFVDQNWAEKVGLKNTAPTTFPQMRFSGNEWQGGRTMQIGSSTAGGSFNGSWIVQDDLTRVAGAHTMRFGYEYRKYFLNERNKNGTGTFRFSPLQTDMPGFSNETGHAFASFLLGAANSAGRGVNILFSGFRHPSHAFYVTDDWKVTPKLTVNFGLRWEVIQPFYEVTDRMSMVDLNVPNPAAAGRKGAFVFDRSRFQDTYPWMIGPRIGFAYQMMQNMVVRGGYGLTNMPPIRNDWGFGGFTQGYSSDIPIVAGTSPTGFKDDPAFWLDNPYPNLRGTLPNTDPGQALFSDVQTTAPDSTRLPYVQNWNFTIQYQLPRELVLETAYIGNKGTRLWNSYWKQLNVLPASMLRMGDVLNEQVSKNPQFTPYPGFDTSQSVAQALRPYPQYGSVTEAYPYYGTSLYNSLQVTLTRHFGSSFGVLGAYTWSKALTYDDNAINYDWTRGTQDYFNRGLERSVASYSIPHVFRLTWLYEPPIGRGKAVDLGQVANLVVGGWKFSAVHEYRSGYPIAISQSGLNTPAGFGDIRPDRLSAAKTLGGAPTKLDYFNGTPYLNKAGWAPSPRTSDGVPLRVGTASRYENDLRGPHASGESFRMVKGFPIWESIRFELGFAATNPLNRHGREVISTDITDADFGKMRISGCCARNIQLEGRISW
ncbi:MAG TPA: carboxypeptidase regulatory-like domain-containing protein [Bryobacteraceae bacterium]|nr:carboxypeptidase regulatory-like domain-containing protein [Bryobacteraceae bacterium]